MNIKQQIKIIVDLIFNIWLTYTTTYATKWTRWMDKCLRSLPEFLYNIFCKCQKSSNIKNKSGFNMGIYLSSAVNSDDPTTHLQASHTRRLQLTTSHIPAHSNHPLPGTSILQERCSLVFPQPCHIVPFLPTRERKKARPKYKIQNCH